MKLSYQGWGEPAYPGETPEAQVRRNWTENDLTKPDIYHWIIVGNQLFVSEKPIQDLLDEHGFANLEKPHAYGRMALAYRWGCDWQILNSNIALHIVGKLLKQYAAQNGYQMGSILDADGEEHPAFQKTAGSIDRVPVLIHRNGADWRAGYPEQDHHHLLLPGDKEHDWEQGSVMFMNPEWRKYLEPGQEEDPSELHTNVPLSPEREQEILNHAKSNFDWWHSQNDFKTSAYPGIGDVDPGIKDWKITDGEDGWMQDPPGMSNYFGKPDDHDDVFTCINCGDTFHNTQDLSAHLQDHMKNPQKDWQPYLNLDVPLPAHWNNSTVPGWIESMSHTAKADMTGAIVSVEPTDEERKKLAMPGGEPPHQLHVTVAPLGQAADVDMDHLHKVMSDWASDYKPIKGKIEKMHTFPSGDDEEEVAHVGLIHSPELHKMRSDLVDRLNNEGIKVDDKFPEYKPHVTVAYRPKDEPFDHDISGQPITFNNLTVRAGNDVTHYPLGQKSLVTAAAPQIPGPIPFIYDVNKDEIHVGHPGEVDQQVEDQIEGDYDPTGLVRGEYKPNGELEITTTTNIPYTATHLIQLWYYMYRQLEIKSVVLNTGNGSPVKLAGIKLGSPTPISEKLYVQKGSRAYVYEWI